MIERQFPGQVEEGIWGNRRSLLRICIPMVLTAVMGLSGCMSRSGGSVPLPYVKPANSIPSPPASVPPQMVDRMQAMEAELQRLWDRVERLSVSGGDPQAITGLQERIAFIENQLGIDAAVRTRVEAHRSAGAPVATQAAERASRPRDGAAAQPVRDADSSQPPRPVEIRNPSMSSDQEDYRHAYAALRSGEHEKALQLFEAFLNNHPKSDLVASSLYWAGEAHFALAHFDEAVLYFDRVIKEHPGSSKELSALLKQGESFEKMGDSRSARIIFQKLVSDHPHTAQARLAAGRLKALPAAAPEQS